jgi:hypothetical protein
MAKTMPLNEKTLDGQDPTTFFGTTLPARSPAGKFYVYGRDNYIAKDTAPKTLVLFHLGGKIVAHARLQADWKQPNDDSTGRPDALAVYLFEDAVPLSNPMPLTALPSGWQEEWPQGRFDQNPRTLDEQFEAAFLASAT